MPSTVRGRTKRVLVATFQSARKGGSWALAAFQFRPLLGRSIVGLATKASSRRGASGHFPRMHADRLHRRPRVDGHGPRGWADALG